MLRKEIPVRLYKMEQKHTSLKLWSLFKDSNVDMTWYWNAYGILALKLPEESTGEQKCFKTYEHIWSINITTVQAFLLWMAEHEWRTLKGLPLELAE